MANGIEPSHAESFAVISDIHGNVHALREVVRLIRQRDSQNVLVLGDLLTYGCAPNAVIELLQELQRERRCVFVKGNHPAVKALILLFVIVKIVI